MLQYMLCLLFCSYDTTVPTEVATGSGRLKGTIQTSRGGKPFLAFRGIPYAKPPINDLRFQDPVPISKWDGVRDATRPGNPCVQWNYLENGPTTGNEDCLYLSVFTPIIQQRKVEESPKSFKKWKKIDKFKKKGKFGVQSIPVQLLPVIVYIHGGCFEFGDGEDAGEGPEYYMDEPVVYVKINYRLGALGFLSFEDDVLTGNYGLKDQNLALKWIKDNIIHFGGDPAKITISGESAGAASVHFHMLSPLSRGLFHQAIASSGSGYSPWALAKDGRARETAIKTAELLGCASDSSKEILECLKRKDAFHIVDQRRVLITEYVDPVCLYVPVIDCKAKKPFLPDALHKLVPAKVDVLFGITSADGLLKTAFYTKYGSFDWSPIEYYFQNYFKDVLLLQPDRVGIEEEIEDIRNFYLGDESLSDDSFPQLTNLFTDGWFFIPMVEAFKNHSNHAYLYYMDHLGQNSYADVFGTRRIVEGTSHRDEAIYLLNITNNPRFQPLYGKDLKISKQLIKVWTDFARTGNPGKSKCLSLGDWQHREYLEISSSGFVVKKDLLSEVIKFWLNLNIIN